MIDEAEYERLADRALGQVEDLFSEVDPEDVDLERAGDVIRMTFRDRSRCVVNTQRAVRQIWLAANARGWHFDWDATLGAWVDARHTGGGAPGDGELFGVLRAIVRDCAKIELAGSPGG